MFLKDIKLPAREVSDHAVPTAATLSAGEMS